MRAETMHEYQGILLDRAIRVAAEAHRGQRRKGLDVPFITHPFAVALLLCRAGCREEVLVVGLLHDTLEDTELVLDDIRRDFGETVASIVAGCSEPDKSMPWEDRKKAMLRRLESAAPDVRIVTCADKLHNLRSMVSDYETEGEGLWEHFTRGREKQAWYYREMVSALGPPADGPVEPAFAWLYERFKREVEDFFG